MTKLESLNLIKELVQNFEKYKEQYLRNEYKENHLEINFVIPFIKALGWDVDNKGSAPQFREVVTQDTLKIGNSKKAPDYGFGTRGNDTRLFYIEAKAAHIKIKTEKEPAHQLRRYGRSGKTAVSILFNFNEMAIYDCTQKQTINSDAKFARLKYFTCNEYEENFDFIYDTFSKEAITNGNFNKYIEDKTQKKGNVALDKDFVDSLNRWRYLLAKSIAKSNVKLNDEEINVSVQLLLDRLIFLRFCEERDVEPMGQLLTLIKHANSYKHLHDIFLVADKKYNSGLFDFEKDNHTLKLKIENEVLKEIIEDLYPPLSDYAFAIMPVEILGIAYEQFLGHIIRITTGHNIKIEAKPEVRKAGGVYYTPQYIVEKIVENTVGKLITGKTPKEIEKIKIVDPACGSGSFLLGAYKYILNYHQNWYYGKNPKSKELTEYGMLTTNEKRKILTNNIFGVDLDANAVEVSKLSLLLKCMEGETASSVKQQLSLYHARVLPNIDKNIVNGNSLIGFDFFENEFLFDKTEEKALRHKIKPFDWKVAFPDIFKHGGFDAVIGNPPYVSIENLTEEIKQYLFDSYETCKGRTDIYVAFIEKNIKQINKAGILSFIIPYAFTNQNYGTLLRQKLIKDYHIDEIIDTSNYFVFDNAIVKNIILTIRNRQEQKNLKTTIVKFDSESAFIKNVNNTFQLNQNIFSKLEDSRLETKPVNTLLPIKKKIWQNSVPLSDICLCAYGARLNHKTENIGKDFFISDKKQKGYKPFLEGKNIKRYYFSQNGWLNYSPDEHYNSMFPELFENEKIMFIRVVKDRLRFAFDDRKFYNSHTVINCVRLDKLKKAKHITARKAIKDVDLAECSKYHYFYLLAILNSRLINWYFRQFLSDNLNFYPNDAKSLPIKVMDKKNSNELVKLTEKLMDLYSNFYNKGKDDLESQIQYYENQVDELVYKLYELTPAEIKIVEE